MTPAAGLAAVPPPPPKPLLRGWIHAVTAPAAAVAGTVLTLTAPTTAGRIAAAIFTLSAVTLFGISATYHRGTWSVPVKAVLRRLDHSAIFLIIAGTYTPLAVMLLSQRQATILLSVVWAGALLGVLFRVLWVGAPRWLYTPMYIALGWVAVWYLPQFAHAGWPLLALVVGGGLLYTAGAVAYALKRPDPAPEVFGYHEIFHACTAVAFAAHATAVAVALRVG